MTGIKKIELKFIILKDRKFFVNISSTFLKFPNIGIDEINLQKIMGGWIFNINVGKNNSP